MDLPERAMFWRVVCSRLSTLVSLAIVLDTTPTDTGNPYF